MSDRFERNQRTALFTAFDKIAELIKNELVAAEKNQFTRLKKDGSIVLMGVGKADKVIFTYDQKEFFDTPFEHFKAYSLQVISVASDVTYNPNGNQVWNVMIDDVLLKFQNNAESKEVDVVIII